MVDVTVLKDIADLAAAPYNPRQIGKDAASGLAASIDRFGDIAGIVFNAKTQRLVCGHQRVEQLRKLGAQLFHEGDKPVLRVGKTGERFAVRVVEWDEAQEKAANIAANNPYIGGDFTDELQELLKEVHCALGNEGFDELQLGALLEPDRTPGDDDAPSDTLPEPPNDPVTKRGDVWSLGEHRVLCEDAATAKHLMSASLVFTSPPYGQQRDYKETSTHGDWLGMMRGVFGNLPAVDETQVLVTLGLVHSDGEWHPYWSPWVDAMREIGWRRFGLYVWDQGWGLPGNWGARLAPSFELVFHFNRQNIDAIKWVECRAAGQSVGAATMRRKDGTLQRVSADTVQDTKVPDSVIRENRQVGGVGHPAPFSINFAEHIIKTWGGDIYDPFGGSGTTLLAAERLGRKAYLTEIEPAYCDVIVERWEQFTGGKAKRGNA